MAGEECSFFNVRIKGKIKSTAPVSVSVDVGDDAGVPPGVAEDTREEDVTKI